MDQLVAFILSINSAKCCQNNGRSCVKNIDELFVDLASDFWQVVAMWCNSYMFDTVLAINAKKEKG
jgi:hypothetical protein